VSMPFRQFIPERPTNYDAEEHLRYALIGWQEAKMRRTAVAAEVDAARRAADEKHGARSIERLSALHPAWAPVLGEEFGEVMHELTYDSLVDATSGEPLSPDELEAGRLQRLRAELIDLLAVASA